MKPLASTDPDPTALDAETPKTASSGRRPPIDRLPPLPGDDGGELRPIGPQRLRELRERIRNGTYPTDQDVEAGLRRMFLGTLPDDRRSEDGS